MFVHDTSADFESYSACREVHPIRRSRDSTPSHSSAGSFAPQGKERWFAQQSLVVNTAEEQQQAQQEQQQQQQQQQRPALTLQHESPRLLDDTQQLGDATTVSAFATASEPKPIMASRNGTTDSFSDRADTTPMCSANSSNDCTALNNSASRMSRCKRKLQCNITPAFDLGIVHDAVDPATMLESVCNAARCEPISEINDFVFLGTWKDADNMELLAKYHIGYVLNVAAELNPETQSALLAHSKGIISKSIPMKDCHHHDISQNFNDAFAFIEEARQHNSRVLVHCRRGISRSAAIVVAYLMATERQSYQDALDYVTARRPCVCMNLAFQEILSEYEPEIHWSRHTTSNNTDFICNGESSDGDEPTPPSAPQRVGHSSFSAFLDDD